ncbi:DUF5681 domain-containing protein [Geothrix terrae]|uniref:DUF5681 domain-containing protein n=1 Tax=Geothrix terrae TaxID=2922720 RepID=UPI001FAB7065|nr:DUF5681 domain-containing protein [Geothrix terrae]
MSDPGYKVGYRRPPIATRFKKGQSGNPKGRPKGSVNLDTTLERELNQRVTVKEHGQTRTITKFEACIKQLVNKAASGDAKAIQFLISLLNLSAGGTGADQALALSTEADQAVMATLLQRFGPQAPSTLTSSKEAPHEPGP